MCFLREDPILSDTCIHFNLPVFVIPAFATSQLVDSGGHSGSSYTKYHKSSLTLISAQ